VCWYNLHRKMTKTISLKGMFTVAGAEIVTSNLYHNALHVNTIPSYWQDMLIRKSCVLLPQNNIKVILYAQY